MGSNGRQQADCFLIIKRNLGREESDAKHARARPKDPAGRGRGRRLACFANCRFYRRRRGGEQGAGTRVAIAREWGFLPSVETAKSSFSRCQCKRTSFREFSQETQHRTLPRRPLPPRPPRGHRLYAPRVHLSHPSRTESVRSLFPPVRPAPFVCVRDTQVNALP